MAIAQRKTVQTPAQEGPRAKSLRPFERSGAASLRPSTLEALAEGLRLLESEAAGAHVDAVHDALVQKQLRERGYVGKGA